MNNVAVLQLHNRDVFERNVTRAVVAGAGAGVVGFLAHRLLVPVPLAFLALAATAIACAQGGRFERLVLAGLGLALPALPWLFGFSATWSVAAAGAITGALVVKARVAEKGEEGSVAAVRPGRLHYLAAALATGGLAVAGTRVALVLATRLGDIATPAVLSYAASGAVVALFAAIGGIASHVALASDPVEARCEALLPQLSGDFEAQLTRALALYRQCGAQLAALPREAAREELARTLARLTRGAADLAGDWAGVEAQLADTTQGDLDRQVRELRQSAEAARDAVARAQLEGAAASLEEELGRLAELRLKRERVLARLKSQVALLERARVALIGMRSSHATVRAAELSAVARKLGSLAAGQADEARVAHEVATRAELRATEATEADAHARELFAAVSEPPPADAASDTTVDATHEAQR